MYTKHLVGPQEQSSLQSEPPFPVKDSIIILPAPPSRTPPSAAPEPELRYGPNSSSAARPLTFYACYEPSGLKCFSLLRTKPSEAFCFYFVLPAESTSLRSVRVTECRKSLSVGRLCEVEFSPSVHRASLVILGGEVKRAAVAFKEKLLWV